MANDGVREVHLDRHVWHFWSSDRDVAGISFRPEGTIHLAAEPEWVAGYWRVDSGRVLAFGLDELPIAVFDRISAGDPVARLAGVAWGRRFPVEPCSLIAAAIVEPGVEPPA